MFSFNIQPLLSSPNAVTCFFLSTSQWIEQRNEPEFKTLSAGAAKTIKVSSTGLKCWLISGRDEACQPYKIRLLCCQLVTQCEQKLLNEKVGSFHPVSVCVCPSLRNRPASESLLLSLIGRSSLWGVWLPLKWGNRCQNTAAGALRELCSLRSHGLHGPHLLHPTDSRKSPPLSPRDSLPQENFK